MRKKGAGGVECHGCVIRFISRKVDTNRLNDASYLVSDISVEQAGNNYGKNNWN
jgi:hypothetical protein